MTLTETEKYMLAGATGVVAERITDAASRKYLQMPFYAFVALAVGTYFTSHAAGIIISNQIDPQKGKQRYRETSDLIYRSVTPGFSGTERVDLLTRAILVAKTILYNEPSYRPSHHNDPSYFYYASAKGIPIQYASPADAYLS